MRQLQRGPQLSAVGELAQVEVQEPLDDGDPVRGDDTANPPRRKRRVARTVIIGGCRRISTVNRSVTLFPTGSRDLARMP
jgi:hypothetical protein